MCLAFSPVTRIDKSTEKKTYVLKDTIIVHKQSFNKDEKKPLNLGQWLMQTSHNWMVDGKIDGKLDAEYHKIIFDSAILIGFSFAHYFWNFKRLE